MLRHCARAKPGSSASEASIFSPARTKGMKTALPRPRSSSRKTGEAVAAVDQLFNCEEQDAILNDDHNALPAAAPDAQAHWKLNPPRWPVTSTTSPMKNKPGILRLSMVLAESSSVSTPPAVTSAFS